MRCSPPWTRSTTLCGSREHGCSQGSEPPSTATTVDNTGGGTLLTHGPFTEAKEYLGGFWIIEAENDEAAIEWTKRASRALQSRVEVRALQERPDA